MILLEVLFALNVGCIFTDPTPFGRGFNAAVAAWLMVTIIRKATQEDKEE